MIWCQQCGGLILESGKAYRYAGKICGCPKALRKPVDPLTGRYEPVRQSGPACTSPETYHVERETSNGQTKQGDE